MRVLGRALVLGLLVVVCAPRSAAGAPFRLLGEGDPDIGSECGTALAPFDSDKCRLFSLESLSAELEVGFSSWGDVALFEFTLSTDTPFSVTTQPIWTDPLGGPFVGVYHHATAAEHALALYSFTASDGAEYFALNEILSPPDPLSPDIPLILPMGSYYFALSGPENNLREVLGTGFDLDGDERLCEEGMPGCSFSVTFHAGSDGNPAPVPEPGTLTLMAGGAIAGLLHRRRTRKR